MHTVSLGRQVPVQALTGTSIPFNQNSANFPLSQHLCEFFVFTTSPSNFQGFASRVPALEGIGLFISPSSAQQEYARLLWESPYCAPVLGLNYGSHSMDTQSVGNAARVDTRRLPVPSSFPSTRFSLPLGGTGLVVFPVHSLWKVVWWGKKKPDMVTSWYSCVSTWRFHEELAVFWTLQSASRKPGRIKGWALPMSAITSSQSGRIQKGFLSLCLSFPGSTILAFYYLQLSPPFCHYKRTTHGTNRLVLLWFTSQTLGTELALG